MEIEKDFDIDLLSIKGYAFELEKNSVKSRTGVYLLNTISYERICELEGRC